MSTVETVVEKRFHLSLDHVDYLSRLAQSHRISEDRVVEQALDILFTLTNLLDERIERPGWSFLSEAALQRVWDNEEDAVYDGWRDVYGVSTR